MLELKSQLLKNKIIIKKQILSYYQNLTDGKIEVFCFYNQYLEKESIQIWYTPKNKNSNCIELFEDRLNDYTSLDKCDIEVIKYIVGCMKQIWLDIFHF